jgi:hypothetical protein
MDDPRTPGSPAETGPTRTRQSIDELAELYLTGMQASAQPRPDPLEGPPPIRLAPKPVAATAPSAAVLDAHPVPPQPAKHPDDPGHPILRLTEGDDTAERQELLGQDAPDNDRPAHGERPAGSSRSDASDDRAINAHRPAYAQAQAVILGNLPGISGPWLTQYAQLTAQQRGPVVVLHVDEETIDLELVEPREEAQPAVRSDTPAVRIPPAAPGSGLVGLLDALVRAEQAPVQTVLVRLPAEPDAMAVSRLSALEDWTVLCGADDASVVATYRMLKQVVEHDPRNAGKHVGLMVMGSDEPAVHHAADKIATAAASHLSTPVRLVGQLQQMQPVSVRQLGSFPDPVGVWPELVAWMRGLETPADESPPPPADKPEEKAMSQHAEPIISPHLRVPPRPARPQAPHDEPAPPTGPESPDQAHRPQAPRTAMPVREQAAPPATTTAELDLFALLNQGPAAIPGGTPLEARIPAAPSIQLALDAQGVVHLLVQHALADDPRRAVPELMEAKRWAEENRSLLALTQRDRGFAPAPPVLHLFTDRPEQATALVARLGDTLRLHLLQKVTLGRETGWFCTPLN